MAASSPGRTPTCTQPPERLTKSAHGSVAVVWFLEAREIKERQMSEDEGRQDQEVFLNSLNDRVPANYPCTLPSDRLAPSRGQSIEILGRNSTIVLCKLDIR